MKPLFICGMSRGGTTWLGNCLNEHSECAVYGESLYWGRFFRNPDNGSYYLPETAHKILKDVSACCAFLGAGPGNLKAFNEQSWRERVQSLPVGDTDPATLFLQINQLVSDTEGKLVVVEKTPHHVNWIPRILNYLPDARFIIMVREPYSFMLSYKHQGDRKPAGPREHFKRLYHPLVCSLIWKRYCRTAIAMHHKYPKQTMLADFHMMRQQPEDSWNTILSFLGLSYEPRKEITDRNSSFKEETKPELEPTDIFWMNRLAGRTIVEGGYSKRLSHCGLIALLVSLWKLLPWVWYVGRHLRKWVSGNIFRYLWGSR